MSARLERSGASWARRKLVVQLAAAHPGECASVCELFSGTKSFSKAALRAVPAARTVTVDMRASQKPTHCVNILTWDYRAVLVPGEFDVLWASPPCTEYSAAKTVGERNLRAADACVLRTFEIIDYLKPRVWFIENPDTGLLPERMRSLRPRAASAIVDYCQYGYSYRKRTRIWSNLAALEYGLKLCPGRAECHAMQGMSSHSGTFGGPPTRDNIRTSLSQKNSIPDELMDWLFWRAAGGLVVLPLDAQARLAEEASFADEVAPTLDAHNPIAP